MEQSKQSETKNLNDIISEIPSDVLEEIRNNAREKAVRTAHEWRQRGPYLVCISCEQEHAVHIGAGKMLVGVDNGIPKIIEI